MKKSADITKYEPEWQMVRAKVKGPMVKLEDKLRIVNQYYERHKTVDAWERVVNWLQGLQMGYKAAGDTQSIEHIASVLVAYNGMNPTTKEFAYDDDRTIKQLQQYPFNDRLLLWKDLFDRNKKWLAKGYNHAEHNKFTDALWKTFELNHESVPSAFDMSKLEELRNKSAKLKNTHKFFF